jgi:hypothetical protein
MSIVTPFFDYFPKIKYDIRNQTFSEYEEVTNIFHRLGYIKEVLNNAASYVVYEIEEQDTPEIVAEKFYNDAGAGWMVLYANQIIDPQFDWPLNEKAFRKYIIEKYGSIETSKITYHHYEKVTERTIGDITTVTRSIIGKERYTQNNLTVPYEYYTPFESIETETTRADVTTYKADNVSAVTADADNDVVVNDQGPLATYTSYKAYNIDGETLIENIYGAAISNYDYEYNLNESKRTIKVVKAEYYSQIMEEFRTKTKSLPKYVRTFV